MSDVNAAIQTVDQAMDMMEAFSREVHDLRAHMIFELKSFAAAHEQEQWTSEARRELLTQCDARAEELIREWTALCLNTIDLAMEAKQKMGEYICKLNKIASGEELNPGGAGYRVVIVDSRRYPQTAEHIKRAQDSGFPEFVTLKREGAAARRKDSLEAAEVRSIYDRDEWPMAVFLEGGSGANVVYVEGNDNRGAGSSIGWQMRGLPDGTRIRVRVI